MESIEMRTITRIVLSAVLVALPLVVLAQATKTTEKPKTVELVQTPGQFEPQTLELPAGQYVFKIVNKNVDHEVGFWLQQDTEKGPTVPKSGTKHIKKGETASTGVVTLKPGKYVYSCPLNPTPHYVITVK